MKDYYSILKISRSATSVEIKTAYRNLSKKFHPDVNKASNATVIFIEIKEAYEVLIDDSRRNNYNKLLDFSLNKQSQQIEIIPTIVVFYSDTAEFSIGDIVTFTWKVYDADVVELRPFGKVENSGTKKIRINEVNKNLLVELFCYNSISKNYVFSQIVLVKKQFVRNSDTFQRVNPNDTEKQTIKKPNNNSGSFKFNKQSKLSKLVWTVTLLNIIFYFIYPFIYVNEIPIEATRAYSKNNNGSINYFIEFEDFTIEASEHMAINLQRMDKRTVFFGINTNNDNVEYFRIQTDSESIKQGVYQNDINAFLALFYIILLVLQFYLTFIEKKLYLKDSFAGILGFLFVFNLAISYIIYQIIWGIN